MKIVTRDEFMKLPIGTIWSYYEPSYFRQLNIKVSDKTEWENDFLVNYLIGAVKHYSSEEFFDNCKEMKNGESLPVDFWLTGREGLFDDKQLFAIYEDDDVKMLIKRLKKRKKKIIKKL